MPKALILRRFLGAPVLLVLALVTVAPAFAARSLSEVYAVSGVEVDVTAGNAAAAREQAIDEAHVAAFDKLMDRLVLDVDRPRAPRLSAQQVRPLLLDFSVEEERTSAVRYIGTLGFQFDRKAVRDLLRQSRLRFAEAPGPRLAVIPIFGAGAAAELWEDENPWLAAWRSRLNSGGLVELVPPLGDLTDMSAIDAQGALAGEQGQLGAYAARYQAEGVLVAQAIARGDPLAGTGSLQILGSDPLRERGLGARSVTLNQRQGESPEDFLARGAAALDALWQEPWKRQVAVAFDLSQETEAAAHFGPLEEWLDIRERLDRVTEIAAVTVTSLAHGSYGLKLAHSGPVEQLQGSLSRVGLALTQDEEGLWSVSRAAAQ